jgi:hypothetical protein
MNRRIVVGVMGLLAIGAVVTVLMAREPGPSSTPVLHGFTLPYVLIETKDRKPVVFENPEVRMLGSRTYLVGWRPEMMRGDQNGSYASTRQWIHMEDVQHLGEVRTVEQAIKVWNNLDSERADRERADAAASK